MLKAAEIDQSGFSRDSGRLRGKSRYSKTPKKFLIFFESDQRDILPNSNSINPLALHTQKNPQKN